MNLWILQHYATPPDTVSGTRHFNFAKELSQYGYDATIFASSFNHSSYREERLSEAEQYRIEDVQGVRFFWIKTPWYNNNGWKRMRNMIAFAVRSFRLSKALNQWPDIIWASNPHLFSGLSGYWLARKYRAHFVFEVRDLWPQVFVDIGAFSPRHPLILTLRLIERFVYSRAEKLIVLMGKASDYLHNCGVEPEKILYLPHGVGAAMFGGTEETIPTVLEPARLLKTQGKTVIGYVGAHGIADALDTVVDCCSLLKGLGRSDLHFVMVGNGSEKERLEKKASERGLDNITFFGAIPKTMVPSAIRMFDLAIVSKKRSPLYKYGTSFIKTFDYMASGVPILWAVDSPDCPVTDAGCGLVVPAEVPEKMAEAVVSFCSMDEEMRRQMGRQGLEYVKSNHDNRSLVIQLKELFECL